MKNFFQNNYKIIFASVRINKSGASRKGTRLKGFAFAFSGVDRDQSVMTPVNTPLLPNRY